MTLDVLNALAQSEALENINREQEKLKIYRVLVSMLHKMLLKVSSNQITC